jgi:hypothetical protein
LAGRRARELVPIIPRARTRLPRPRSRSPALQGSGFFADSYGEPRPHQEGCAWAGLQSGSASGSGAWHGCIAVASPEPPPAPQTFSLLIRSAPCEYSAAASGRTVRAAPPVHSCATARPVLRPWLPSPYRALQHEGHLRTDPGAEDGRGQRSAHWWVVAAGALPSTAPSSRAISLGCYPLTSVHSGLRPLTCRRRCRFHHRAGRLWLSGRLHRPQALLPDHGLAHHRRRSLLCVSGAVGGHCVAMHGRA